MHPQSRLVLMALMLACLAVVSTAKDKRHHSPSQPIFVITNDDGVLGNDVSFWLAGNTQQGPTLTLQTALATGGRGIGGGFFGSPRVAFLPDSSAQCLYASNAGTNNITTINLQSQQAMGSFSGFRNDKGTTNGIGLAVNSNYLYAGFTASNTLVTFAVQAGCQLSLLGDMPVAGLNGGFTRAWPYMETCW